MYFWNKNSIHRYTITLRYVVNILVDFTESMNVRLSFSADFVSIYRYTNTTSNIQVYLGYTFRFKNHLVIDISQ